MKKTFYFLCFCCLILGITNNTYAQVKPSVKEKADTVIKKKDTSVKKKDTVVKKSDSGRVKKITPVIKLNDSLKKIAKRDSVNAIKKIIEVNANNAVVRSQIAPAEANLPETISTDTLRNESKIDSTGDTLKEGKNDGLIVKKLLEKNKWINAGKPVYHIEIDRTYKGKEFIFYALFSLVLILGIFKTFYNVYFNNLFRVFFNTSLRQTQLTDQLLQAKLPSLLLNVFFTLSAGMYIWILFSYFNPPRLISRQLLLPVCILVIGAIYVIKYILLKFTGWVTGIQQITDNYIFVIFLVNKITGILLLPFIILLAFAPLQWISPVATISVLVLGLFFLSRYAKSYGLIENRMPVNPFHFILYIIGAEIIPLLILYKVAVDYVV